MFTTQPPPSSDQDGRRGVRRFVRWVFPSTLVTALEQRHVVGRDDSCDTVLGGSEISRRHAEFRVEGPVAAVRDLGSRNGVFVNGVRRPDAPLGAGDVVRCGEWLGVVTIAADAGDGFREIAPGWYGGSALATAVEPARRVPADLPIVVQGETGTGKQSVAQTVHHWSGRVGPFVAVDCAGADAASVGRVRAARGGTLFLDEIGDLAAALQPQLLQAIGDTAGDVRVVAATREPLGAAVTQGRLRADLAARLDGLTVVLPPLRQRREDVAPLFLRVLEQQAGGQVPAVEGRLIEALCLYDWPLNVREVMQLARRMLVAYGHEAVLRKAQLPERILLRRSEPDVME